MASGSDWVVYIIGFPYVLYIDLKTKIVFSTQNGTWIPHKITISCVLVQPEHFSWFWGILKSFANSEQFIEAVFNYEFIVKKLNLYYI